MRTNTPSLEDYWTTLARLLPAFSADQQRTALTLYRELAKGTPVATERVATALGVTPQQAAAELAREPLRAFVYADQGHVVGFGGLAVRPMHHEFRVKGQTLWTWCAWDSLFIPAVLGERADVSSPDPETRERVRLTVSPIDIERVEPSDAVVSFLLPDATACDQSAENVMGQFCHSVFFFTSRASAERWQARHDGTFLYSIADAFALGLRLVRKQFGHELERLYAGPAGAASRRADTQETWVKPRGGDMRAIAGIIAVATVGMVACSGSTTVERQAVTQVAQQAHADLVSVLTVEGMT